MAMKFARYAVALVVLLAIIGAVIKIATAQDRIRDRKQTAQSVCVSSGGNWVKLDRDEVCVLPQDPKPN
jgi:hypothetical protein